jgi:hypothetical protein
VHYEGELAAFLKSWCLPPAIVLTIVLFLLISVLGDPRVNQNPAFLALGILFYRWHNLQAAKVQQQHPDWDDEDVFQGARRRVIATLQVFYCHDFDIKTRDSKHSGPTNRKNPHRVPRRDDDDDDDDDGSNDILLCIKL